MSDSVINGPSSTPPSGVTTSNSNSDNLGKTFQSVTPNYQPTYRTPSTQQPPTGGLRPQSDVGPQRPQPPQLQRLDSRGQFSPRLLPPQQQPQSQPSQQSQPQQQPSQQQLRQQVNLRNTQNIQNVPSQQQQQQQYQSQQRRPSPPIQYRQPTNQSGAPQSQSSVGYNQPNTEQNQPNTGQVYQSASINQRTPTGQGQSITGQSQPVPIQQVQRSPGNVPNRPVQSPTSGNFKRFVTALQQGQLAATPEDSVLQANQTPIFQQRPPQPGSRPPSVFPPKNLPSGPSSIPPDLQPAPRSALNKQQSFTRKPSQEAINFSKLENQTEKPLTTPESGGTPSAAIQSGVDEISKLSSAKSRSYSISVPNAPESVRPLTEEERRRSVAYGSAVPGSDGKLPSSLAFIQERIASIEGKSSSQSSLNDSKESLQQNGKGEVDDDDDVVIPSRQGITPPKSYEASKSPSPAPPQNYIPSNLDIQSSDATKTVSHSKSPSPNISTKSSIHGSQEEMNKIPSRPPSNIDRSPGPQEEPPRVTSRPPSGLVRNLSRSSILGSQEDVQNAVPRSPTGLVKDSSKGSSREDVRKIPSRPPSATGHSTREQSRSGSREEIRSRPPSSTEKEMSPHPPMRQTPTPTDEKPAPTYVTQNSMKDSLMPEMRSTPQKSPSSEKIEKRSVEPKTPDSLVSTDGKDITSPDTDISTSRGDFSSSPAPPKARTSDSGRKSGTPSRSRSRTGKSEDEETVGSRSGRSSITKTRAPSSRSKEGDNDSGVDESTQGNECTNGDIGSPKKSSKIPGLKHSSSPTKSTPSKIKTPRTPKTPDPDAKQEVPLIKKVPMNKIQVGAAPSPNLKTIRSKIGSLDNASYKPGGGKIKIETKKLDFGNVKPKIAAKNQVYTPKGGDKKIPQVKLKWEAKPKVGSLDNATHKPGGGDKKIETVKLDFKDKAKPKVASKDNIKHQPSGGDIKIEQKKLEFKAQSKIGSLDNMKHKPGGGDKKIFDDKDYLKQMAEKGERPNSGTQIIKQTKKVRIDCSSAPPSAASHRRTKYFGVIHESIDEEIGERKCNQITPVAIKQMALLKEFAEIQYQSLPSLKTNSIYYRRISNDYSNLGIIQPDLLPERPASRIGRREKNMNSKSKSDEKLSARKSFRAY